MKLNASAVLYFIVSVHYVFVGAVIKVKVNNAFVTEAKDGLNGRTLKDVSVTSLNFLPNTNSSAIHFVINFVDLLHLSIENNGVTFIPELENLGYVEDISLRKNKISSVKSTNFQSVKPSKINLANNKVTTIEDNSFNEKIRVLNLECNELNTVSATWFDRPDLLENLDVSNNKLSAIRQELFQKFKLKYLNLSGNQIATIEPGSFTNREIEVLNLRSNLLSEINPSIFSPANVHIRRFYLDYNKLNYLSLVLMNKLYGFDVLHLINVVRTAVGDLKAMSIDGNPWECKCLARVERWLREYKIARHVMKPDNDEPKCVFAQHKPEICADEVNPELYETFSKSVPREQPNCSY